ncbi:MAG: hydantoinase B/oxoprolinase family protein [Myxococcota bacterium]
MTRTFVDRGGTFTDVVEVDDLGRASIRKVPSDRAVIGDLAPADGSVTIGTTVATNALLEGTGVPTLLVVTDGFADLATIRDMTRPSLFDPDAVRRPSLATRVIALPGRISADGVELEPLVLPDDWPLDGIVAVAVALLHGPRNPAHELAVEAAIRAAAPDRFVAVGHRVSPEVGYLARIETTVVEAALTPVLRAALARDRVAPSWLVVRSDGTVCPAGEIGAADAVLSGPATGVLAVEAVARQVGVERAFGLDLGGTSTDLCVVPSHRREGTVEVAGVHLRRPTLEVDTIAAGGGSILWSDGVRLGVGPQSAGADPGPQCRGRGGPATLTDAALAVGWVDPGAFDPPLDPARIALPGAATAFLAVAHAQIADAIRRLAASRGLDPRDHALVAFGGAGPQHAAAVAEELGIDLVLVHPAAAVMCAWGQALARRERHAVAAVWAPFPAGWDRAIAAIDALYAGLPAGGERRATVELRHVGTELPLEVPATDPAAAEAAFVAAHRARFGFDRGLPLELVNVRVRVGEPPAAPPTLAMDPFGLGDRSVAGPVRLDAPTTSIVVPAGWTARRDRGVVRLDRANRASRGPSPGEGPVDERAAVAVWASRFQAVAAQAGAVLERTARSVNIRERRDFSCAVFDPDGMLVANAPHVPVHLGAMGETVRDLLRTVPDAEPGQHWLTNDPEAGGSHLPDLTVVSPVRWDGVRLFVACRAHHVDVGGTTPGSMPPRSTTLSDEGFVVRQLPLLRDGRLRPDLAAHLVGARQLDVVAADLEAQIAANAHAARWLIGLGPGAEVAAWARRLQDVASASVDAVLARLPSTAAAEDELDGIPLRVTLTRDLDRPGDRSPRLLVSFAGTGGPHPGNLNAPRAVTRAAVLYALRVLAELPVPGSTAPGWLPLNDGVLRRVGLAIPAPSILAPPVGAAVAGGNVETSQRVVDLVLRAAGWGAGSAGTMNNLTLGGAGWSSYETIGGGQGASPRGPGPSGRQLHMTNTRATDPEVFEHRMPVRVRRFSLRPGSGGDGQFRGGDGLIRELELTAPATVALLATRRDRGAPGMGDGRSGAPGVDAIRRDGRWVAWDGAPVAVEAGDRVRIETPGGGGFTPTGGSAR